MNLKTSLASPIRSTLTLTLAIVPIIFDPSVPEAGGDLRWAVLQSVTFFCLGVIKIQDGLKGEVQRIPKQSLHGLNLFALFCGWATCSAIWTDAPFLYFSMIATYWALLGLLYLIIRLRDNEWYQSLLFALVPAVIINSSLGIAQFLDLHDPPEIANLSIHLIDFFSQSSPPAASFSHKNIAASYTIVMIPILTIVYLNTLSLLSQILSISGLCFSAVFLICTRSRAAWIAFALGVIFVIVLNLFHTSTITSWSKKKIIGILVAMCIAFTIGVDLTSPFTELRSINRTAYSQLKSILDVQNDQTVQIRLAYDINTMAMIFDRPLTGFGPGTFSITYPAYHDHWRKTPRNGYDLTVRPKRTHNDFLQTIAELGVPAGIILLIFSWSFMNAAWVQLREVTDSRERTALYGVAASLIIAAVNSLMDFPFQLPTVPIICIVLIGILLGFAATSETENEIRKVRIVGFEGICACICFFAAAQQATNYIAVRPARHLVHQVLANPRDEFQNEQRVLIDRAFELAPEDPLVRNAIGLVYANLFPGNNVTIDDRLAHIKLALDFDPYSPAHLANSGLYYALKASVLAQEGAPTDLIRVNADLAINISKQVLVVAPFAPEGPAIEGFGHLALGHFVEAKSAFAKSIMIDPAFETRLKKMLGQTGKTSD